MQKLLMMYGRKDMVEEIQSFANRESGVYAVGDYPAVAFDTGLLSNERIRVICKENSFRSFEVLNAQFLAFVGRSAEFGVSIEDVSFVEGVGHDMEENYRLSFAKRLRTAMDARDLYGIEDLLIAYVQRGADIESVTFRIGPEDAVRYDRYGEIQTVSQFKWPQLLVSPAILLLSGLIRRW